ncbi:YjgN family protein [Sphingomonas sp.]|uniref:YjgN family protein n=1 Tax=Sphingomonas sp. TaxID=28214 RepID=UPI001B2B73BA|nr:YjgN family protein [Sphingomonas sp.]MBO9713580.1 DUF898 domain-containing protein [Sphingomonas sp.]
MDENLDRARAFGFHGDWREFAPIAFTNLLLTIVTLGVYTFWARARERRYLWSQTHFIDDRLEWTGTGFELFLGYVMAILIFGIPLGGLSFLFQILVARGEAGYGGLLFVSLYLLGMYLVGVAMFRALRYRLSRTFWHGIRGGSHSQGFGYGLSHVWRNIVGSLVFGFLVPWAMTSLWNKRWNQMSFGPDDFYSEASSSPLIGRYLLYYLLPIVLFVGAFIAAAVLGPDAAARREDAAANGLAVGIIIYILFFVVMGLIALFYYSAYFREVIGSLTLGDLQFEFDATTADWFKLMVVNIALVVFTLGIGSIFLGYRNWRFFITHLNAYGTVNLDEMTQSDTRAPGQGEGLLDAFDVGAF